MPMDASFAFKAPTGLTDDHPIFSKAQSLISECKSAPWYVEVAPATDIVLPPKEKMSQVLSKEVKYDRAGRWNNTFSNGSMQLDPCNKNNIPKCSVRLAFFFFHE
jgi:hypothetical protein